MLTIVKVCASGFFYRNFTLNKGHKHLNTVCGRARGTTHKPLERAEITVLVVRLFHCDYKEGTPWQVSCVGNVGPFTGRDAFLQSLGVLWRSVHHSKTSYVSAVF